MAIFFRNFFRNYLKMAKLGLPTFHFDDHQLIWVYNIYYNIKQNRVLVGGSFDSKIFEIGQEISVHFLTLYRICACVVVCEETFYEYLNYNLVWCETKFQTSSSKCQIPNYFRSYGWPHLIYTHQNVSYLNKRFEFVSLSIMCCTTKSFKKRYI